MPTAVNRVAPFFDAPAKKPPAPVLPDPLPVPVGPVAKLETLSDAVFEAVQLLRTHLRHPDPAVSGKAATTLMNLEMTRIRHAKSVVGTTLPAEVCPLGPLEPLDEVRHGHAQSDTARKQKPSRREWKAAVDRVRRQLQQEADARGLGEFVTFAQARAAYEQSLLECAGTSVVSNPPDDLTPEDGSPPRGTPVA